MTRAMDAATDQNILCRVARVLTQDISRRLLEQVCFGDTSEPPFPHLSLVYRSIFNSISS